jgi:hypothetical protein
MVSYFAWKTRWWAATSPHKVALRRAIALAYDVDREIRLCAAARPFRRRA